MKLTVLGCSTPLPKRDLPCSGYVISHESTTVLLDCGLGVFPALAQHIDPAALSAVWISHMHPDHCADLIALAHWALNVDHAPRIRVLGPPGWDTRLNAFMSADASRDLAHELFNVEYLHGGLVSSIGDLTLTTQLVHHSVTSYGVRVSHQDATFVYSGDTGPCHALEQLATSADLFLCEAGSRTPTEYHMTIQEACELARTAAVRSLLLTHLPNDTSLTEVPDVEDLPVNIARARDEWLVGPARR